MRGYEIATGGGRASEPAWVAPYRQFRNRVSTAAVCDACRRKLGTTLVNNHDQSRWLCSACANPAIDRTQALQTRTQRVLAELRREQEAAHVVGCAVPYGRPTRIREGLYEQFEPGAYDESVVVLTVNHSDVPVATARAFPLRDGLYFEAEFSDPSAAPRRATRASVCFQALEDSTEPYHGGQLRRIHRAQLLTIGLTDRPAYATTWCEPRSASAWKRVYGGLMQQIAAEATV